MNNKAEYTIDQLRMVISGLQRPTPHSERLPLPPKQKSTKSQWLRWLEEYLEPGFYNRKTFVDDAEHAYQQLGNARMIVWLNEAAGEDPRLVSAAMIAAQDRDNKQAEARYARLVLPWKNLAKLLFEQ